MSSGHDKYGYNDKSQDEIEYAATYMDIIFS